MPGMKASTSPRSMRAHYLPVADGAMLYADGLSAAPDPGWFDPAWWPAGAAVASAPAGRGQVHYLDSGGDEWVLRGYRRGGLARHLSERHYLWTGEARTRPFSEWRLLAELHAAGLPVPFPVAALYRRHGPLLYTAALITRRLPVRATLRELCGAEQVPSWVWPAVGQLLRRLHDHGVFHADLNGGNLLVGEDRVWVVDFDQGRRRAAGAWRQRNLARLYRSLRKTARAGGRDGPDPAAWQALLSGYERTGPFRP